jgi:hypothetical protein
MQWELPLTRWLLYTGTPEELIPFQHCFSVIFNAIIKKNYYPGKPMLLYDLA